MARRGGSSGYSIGGNRCARYDAFSDSYAQAYISIVGIFLLAFIILVGCMMSRSGKLKRKGRSKSILRWYHYGLGLLAVIVSFIILVLQLVLTECGVLRSYDSGLTALDVTFMVIDKVAELILLGMVLFLLVPQILKLAGSSRVYKAALFGGAAFFAIMCILAVARVIVYGVLSYQTYISISAGNSYRRLVKGYTVMYLLSNIFAAVFLVIAAFKVKMDRERRKGIVGWIPALIVCLIGYSIDNMVVVFITYGARRRSDLDKNGLLAAYCITLIFYFGAFLVLFIIARATGWEYADQGHPPATQYAHNPADPRNHPVGGQPGAPYGGMQQMDPTKMTGYPQSSTPAPPYAAAQGMPYSGNGMYEPQGQVHHTNTWNSGVYAPTPVHQIPSPVPQMPMPMHQMPMPYNAPLAAANRDSTATELPARQQ
ncbi:hypothetical protein DRE_01455 [Drechslerella stenobrocha 248]|uniref:Uncharacterized protein n=1 Tax=Drechslerella stenobrocha 248 TaxID=1043628 RepID=W7HUR2_9PEZI|nr:hypothetical protein DRE_01455 [Drechslerella stenobrocha 248]